MGCGRRGSRRRGIGRGWGELRWQAKIYNTVGGFDSNVRLGVVRWVVIGGRVGPLRL